MANQTIYCGTCQVKATGERFEYTYKRSWGHTYYSFDGGDTWHRRTLDAFRAAEAAGKLHRKGEVKVVCHD